MIVDCDFLLKPEKVHTYSGQQVRGQMIDDSIVSNPNELDHRLILKEAGHNIKYAEAAVSQSRSGASHDLFNCHLDLVW